MNCLPCSISSFSPPPPPLASSFPPHLHAPSLHLASSYCSHLQRRSSLHDRFFRTSSAVPHCTIVSFALPASLPIALISAPQNISLERAEATLVTNVLSPLGIFGQLIIGYVRFLTCLRPSRKSFYSSSSSISSSSRGQQQQGQQQQQKIVQDSQFAVRLSACHSNIVNISARIS